MAREDGVGRGRPGNHPSLKCLLGVGDDPPALRQSDGGDVGVGRLEERVRFDGVLFDAAESAESAEAVLATNL